MNTFNMDKTYQPENFESGIYESWEKNGFFRPSGRTDRKAFSIALPPPNVTGSLHMGHAFQQTIMDALTRFHRMMGDNTLWQCGTDHAGIATQMVVERKLAKEEGKTRHDLGREEFISRIWKWKAESGGVITRQMRRLGTSVDWSRERFTMDEGLSRAVLEVFVRLYDEGLIYRGKRLVNWDPKLRTAISDLEVENREVQGSMWYIRYKLADGVLTSDGKDYLLVATTRPETLLGDTAVAVNPADPRFQSVIGKKLILPLCGRQIPVVADEHADMTTGTGCVKITPAHDFNDYAVGKRHMLPMVNIFTEDACVRRKAEVFDTNGVPMADSDLNLIPEAYQGLDRFAAREKILEDLKAQDLLDHTEPHTLAQPFGDRGGVPIEPMLTDQWYVKASVLGRPAIEAVRNGDIQFVPKQYENMYFAWMENLQDWCISRQLWWGHRIPAWYGPDGKVYVARDEQEVRQKYSLEADVKLERDPDVLDTWFSSALWTFSTLGWPEQTPELKTFHPTSVLVTGFDIIFFWVARMIMMTLHFIKDENGRPQVPFRTVYVTGLIRDEEGKKMSKSKGNIIDPLDMIDGIDIDTLVRKRTANMMQPQLAQKIEKRTRKQFSDGIAAHGTDALRFTLCALASNGRDINWDMKRLDGYRNFCNKIWNACRYTLMNTEGLKVTAPEPQDLGLADRYILSRLSAAVDAVHASFAEYRFDQIATTLYEFIWNELCDWYLEISKTVLKDSEASETSRNAVAYTLLSVLETTMRLAHPILPFLTEVIWQQTAPRLERFTDCQSVMLAPYPEKGSLPRDEDAEQQMAFLQNFAVAVRNLRAEMKIPPAKVLSPILRGATETENRCVRDNLPFLCRLANIDKVAFESADSPAAKDTVSRPLGTAEVLLSTDGLINNADELKRLEAMKARLAANIAGIERRLASCDFINKAPAAIIDGAKAQLKLNQEQLAQVSLSIERLNRK